MKVGFIGTGSMGSILIEAFIQSGALNPEQIVATNRTIDKVERLAAVYPGLQVALSNIEVVRHCRLIFLCIKPGDYKTVIDEIRSTTEPEQIIVSITSPVLIQLLEEQLPSKIAKIIPSITNYVFSGATLCIYGDRLEAEDKELLDNLMSHISAPIRVSEQFTRISSDLSSCGPAFIAFFLEKFVQAAVEETGIAEAEATQLACEMLLGTGKLLTTGGFSPATLQKRVSVPGGITAEGLRIMQNELHGLFNNLVRTTHSKYEEDLEKVGALFSTNKDS
ncbi:late competence protein ComER [Paenibacillus sp. NPDC056579]|uniref:late competence protein ComER n=1 Tax=unclassified Paenibacillus TaxID=185978 RepID=UPI001EF88AA0|nr:late competence protein ComER [Paenibacillus sp. H1-7]ULL17698.1 late competence protein ComER [Paenibacillus sp. H1-7]